MEVSFVNEGDIDEGRAKTVIGRVTATSRWRAGEGMGTEAERHAAIEALMREASEYGADGVVDVKFEIDAVTGHDIEGVPLRRVTASGLAVCFARAA